MAKKSKKIEKVTRGIMDSTGNLVKRKGDRYKFRNVKKREIKQVKKHCIHWIMRKGVEVPTLIPDPANPANWKCAICGAVFPIHIREEEEYKNNINKIIEDINQLQFWSVKFGGNKEDTRLFLELKVRLTRFAKVQRNLIKQVDKRAHFEDRKKSTDTIGQFDSYAGFQFK